jgi:negative regulator of sigma E activity
MIKSYCTLVILTLFGLAPLMAIPVQAETASVIATEAQAVPLEVQLIKQPQSSEENREAPVSIAQTQPAPADAKPVSTRVPLSSRIFTAPSMQQ